jgi:hypothetical protein
MIPDTEDDLACEWCGWDFPPTSAEGLTRADCMNRGHMESCCSNCGTCLHASHRSSS